MKPELSEERIAWLKEWSTLVSPHAGPDAIERAETALALIESRKQALDLLREVLPRKAPHKMTQWSELHERIAEFLEENR